MIIDSNNDSCRFDGSSIPEIDSPGQVNKGNNKKTSLIWELHLPAATVVVYLVHRTWLTTYEPNSA